MMGTAQALQDIITVHHCDNHRADLSFGELNLMVRHLTFAHRDIIWGQTTSGSYDRMLGYRFHADALCLSFDAVIDPDQGMTCPIRLTADQEQAIHDVISHTIARQAMQAQAMQERAA